MKNFLMIAIATALLPLTASAANILQFDTMYAADNGFLGKSIRGVQATTIARQFTSINGSLTTTGHLHIEIVGLIPATTVIPIGGTNPETSFRAIVSCLTPSTKNGPEVENILTEQFPATSYGHATIDADIELPLVCVAPIIFITKGSGLRWLAVTGHEVQLLK